MEKRWGEDYRKYSSAPCPLISDSQLSPGNDVLEVHRTPPEVLRLCQHLDDEVSKRLTVNKTIQLHAMVRAVGLI